MNKHICRNCKNDIATSQHAEAKKAGLCTECWYKPFPITSVCRADLTDALPITDIGKLDDADMIELASKMADAYMNVFWDDLAILVEYILADKRNPQDSAQSS